MVSVVVGVDLVGLIVMMVFIPDICQERQERRECKIFG